MKAKVQSDVTRRAIAIEVVPGSVPDIDVTMTWHKKPRLFRPDRVSLIWVDHKLSQVNISGGLVLKSGGASETVRENQRLYRSDDLTKLPGWLAELAESAPEGCVSWMYEHPITL